MVCYQIKNGFGSFPLTHLPFRYKYQSGSPLEQEEFGLELNGPQKHTNVEHNHGCLLQAEARLSPWFTMVVTNPRLIPGRIRLILPKGELFRNYSF